MTDYSQLTDEQLMALVGGQSPQQPPSKPAPSLMQDIGGAMANFNRGTGVLDEVAGGFNALGNLVSGRDSLKYDANPLGAVKDIPRAFRQGMTDQRALEDDYATRHPNLAAIARGTGAGGNIFVPGGATSQVAAKIPAAASTGSRIAAAVANAGRGAVAAGTQAGVYGAMDRGTAQERGQAANKGLALGAALGAAAPTLATALGGKKAFTPKTAPAPSLDQMKAATTAAYRYADDLGAQYSPKAFDDLVTGVADEVGAAKMNANLTPKTAAVLGDLEKMRGKAPSLTELDQLRQYVRLNLLDKKAADAEQFFGAKILKNIDEFIAAADEGQMVAGKGPEATKAIKDARAKNTAYRKVETLTDAMEHAELQAGGTNAGVNIDNATRQAFKRALQKGNWNDEEAAALKEVVMGTPGQNALRLAGKLAPTNAVTAGMQMLGTGGAFLTQGNAIGGASLIPGAVGLLSKTAADNITKTRANALVAALAKGGPAAQKAEQELLQTTAQASPEGQQSVEKLVAALLRGTGAGAGVATNAITGR